MIKKITFPIMLFALFLSFINFVYADENYNAEGYTDSNHKEQWRYDINNLVINDDTLTLIGWATLKGYQFDSGLYMTSTGKYVGNDRNNPNLEGESPEYYLRLYGNDGSIYPNENGWKYKNTNVSKFSVTCPLYFVVGKSCYNALDSGGYDERNNLSGIYFHDNTDFKFDKVNISGLNPGVEYILEMKISTKDFTTDWKQIQVLDDSIKNNSTNIYKTTPVTEAKMLAERALKQSGSISSSEGGHSLGEYFKSNEIYDVISYKNDALNENHSTGAKYRFFQLRDKTTGNTAWAYSAWIEIFSNTSITTIAKKDPCVDGTKDQTSQEYAYTHPNICCDTYPETCCGNQNYVINSGNFDVTEWQNALCCNSSQHFEMTANGKTYKLNTFNYYINNPTLSTPQGFLNSTTINNTCNAIKETPSKSCKNNTQKISDSELYTASYLRANVDNNGKYVSFIEKENNYTVTINLKSKPNKTLTKDDIAYSYFSQNDYEKYIKQKNNSTISKDNLLVNKSYSKHALENNAFTFQITDLKRITDTKYNVSIKAILNPGYTPKNNPMTHSVLPSNEGVYFLPIKIWFCDKSNDSDGTNKQGDTCNNDKYFESNKAYCCSLPEYKSKDKCQEDDTPKYTWDSNLSCKNDTSSYNNANKIVSSYSDNGGFCQITCGDPIELSGYSTLDYMKSNPIIAGTGFEYDVNIKNKLSCSISYRNKIFDSISSLNSAVSSCENKLLNYGYQDSTSYKNNVLDGQDIYIKSDNLRYKVLDESITEPLESSKPQTTGTASYWGTCDSFGVSIPCIKTKSFNYTPSKSITYNYKIILPTQYINKWTAENVTKIETDEKEYIDGGNRYFTSLTTQTGIYDYNITLENMGTLKNNLGDFTCQYGVENKYIYNGCLNCPGIDPGPNPPDINSTTPGYYFRTISLSNPFPNNRDSGFNWQGNAKGKSTSKTEEYITGTTTNKKGDIVYSEEPMYQITLTSELIREIQGYNQTQERNNKGYLDWNTMDNNDLISNYLDELQEKGLKINVDDRSKRIGDF